MFAQRWITEFWVSTLFSVWPDSCRHPTECKFAATFTEKQGVFSWCFNIGSVEWAFYFCPSAHQWSKFRGTGFQRPDPDIQTWKPGVWKHHNSSSDCQHVAAVPKCHRGTNNHWRRRKGSTCPTWISPTCLLAGFGLTKSKSKSYVSCLQNVRVAAVATISQLLNARVKSDTTKNNATQE